MGSFLRGPNKVPAKRLTLQAAHGPTSLVFELRPLRGGELPPQLDGFRLVGQCRLPPGVPDRRQASRINAGDANAPDVDTWAVLAHEGALSAARQGLEFIHGPATGAAMLQRICKDAGERWIFRARLERGWADGRRAS